MDPVIDSIRMNIGSSSGPEYPTSLDSWHQGWANDNVFITVNASDTSGIEYYMSSRDNKVTFSRMTNNRDHVYLLTLASTAHDNSFWDICSFCNLHNALRHDSWLVLQQLRIVDILTIHLPLSIRLPRNSLSTIPRPPDRFAPLSELRFVRSSYTVRPHRDSF